MEWSLDGNWKECLEVSDTNAFRTRSPIFKIQWVSPTGGKYGFDLCIESEKFCQEGSVTCESKPCKNHSFHAKPS